jgi:hypothetical protein
MTGSLTEISLSDKGFKWNGAGISKDTYIVDIYLPRCESSYDHDRATVFGGPFQWILLPSGA